MANAARARLIGMSGSLRTGSHSVAVLSTLSEKFASRADLRIYDLEPIPPYDEDCEDDNLPAPVRELLSSIAEADGVVLCAPEFNHGMPGVLKNALDWASLSTSVLTHKPVAIMTATRAALGGPRCLEQMRVVLDAMMARVIVAREVIITSVHDKIRDGKLVDETCLGFAAAAVEALLREIELWKAAEIRPGFN
jgi:chromate reductase, NAD(P)H dehydrogenase (quinone)